MTANIKKTLLFLTVGLTISVSAFPQLSLDQMININLGSTFAESKQQIKSMFTQKAKIMKADFFGAYRIEYESVPLNYYGDGYYTFQYAKDTLVSIKVEFTFFAPDTIKFKRLYNTLINDLNTDKSKSLLKQYSDLNASNIFKYVSSNCITTTSKDDENYKPIKSKFLGQNFWSINNNYSNAGKFLRAYVELAEIHMSNSENGRTTKYHGGEVILTLELTSERFQNLKNKEEEMEISNYHSLNEATEQINLKFKNGVYFVPVKLNNTLSIDFVLDLGASDVSISPDIFLVLYRAGTIEENDFIGSQTYQFADGSTAKSKVFNIKSIQIGDKEIKNVRTSINNSLNAPLLLGQSALKKLNSYRIDNYRNLLIIE
jgi:aspartyl protease family protein